MRKDDIACEVERKRSKKLCGMRTDHLLQLCSSVVLSGIPQTILCIAECDRHSNGACTRCDSLNSNKTESRLVAVENLPFLKNICLLFALAPVHISNWNFQLSVEMIHKYPKT